MIKLPYSQIILASGSPRRKEIFAKLVGVEFDIISPSFDETSLSPDNFNSVLSYVQELADRKAHSALPTTTITTDSWLVVSADTIVVCQGRVFNKPTDKEAAKEMLSKLAQSGAHEVHTAVCLLHSHQQQQQQVSFIETTTVHFREDLTADLIEKYISTNEPM